jgi:methylated-DNA-[protein]-cysteine S-methyltransferase
MSDNFVADLCRRFAAHLGGEPVAYDDVPLDLSGLSPFHRELLAAALTIGWGEVVTYGGLAARAGRPRAARAAGSFCAGNRLSLVVPCHRVVAAGRGELYELGSYGQTGAALKRRLLGLEGTVL